MRGTHYTFKEFQRRMKVWKTNNFATDDTEVFKDFFDHWTLKYIQVSLDDSATDHFKSMRVFVERNGKFINYQTAEDNEEQVRLKVQQEAIVEKQRLKREEEQLEKEEELERLKVQQEEIRLKMIKLRHDDKVMVDQKSAYLR